MNTAELLKLAEKYGSDTRRLLTENPSPENLYVFSDRHESLIEWLDFPAETSVLEVGSGYGTLTSALLKKGCFVTVLTADPEEAEFIRKKTGSTGTDITRLKTVYGDFGFIPEKECYDGILFDGNLTADSCNEIRTAKEHLKENGMLIVSSDNAYGIRAWAGRKTEFGAMGKDALEFLLQNGEKGEITRFYPEPGRMFPKEIFSDDYLPETGSLSRIIPAYDYPKYTVIDVGKKYDDVIRDHVFPQFADSFLFIWKRKNVSSGPSGRPVYVKYNRNRKPEYQLKTVIRKKEDGSLAVTKEALQEAGKEHIRAFEANYELLTKSQPGIRYAAPEISADGTKVGFPWVEGESLTKAVANRIRNGEEFTGVLRAALDLVFSGEEIHNTDSVFDNFLKTENGLGGIDYEWVSKEPLEKPFATWRTLRAFYQAEYMILNLGTEKDFLSRFGISEEETAEYRKKEEAFQHGITGDEQEIYLNRYLVETKNAEKIAETDRSYRTASDRINGLKAQLDTQDTEIRKMTEVKRLTDNHVTNLSITIANLRHENEELGKTLTYLNGHQTITSKTRRKLGDAFNKKYPKGSVQRKKLDYLKMQLSHPVQYHKMTSTEEGKNLIEGDFRIGSIYRKYGRLHFPVYETPLVSIVIPCYNQIRYTYACLQSVLEFTVDIPYEVIIADDVSTDATKDLDRYAENLVICRNETNQGFLKNCNHAAAKARGSFIMFLNNDTKVTEAWLSSLLSLMKENPDIGMTGSKLVYPDGRLQEAGGIIWSDASGWNYGRLQNPDACEYNYVKDVDYISGAAILIRSSLWKEIGGFDERYAPAYCEDSDLAFEVRKHGYRVTYQPKSVVVHFEGISNGTDVQGSGLKKYQTVNTEKFRAKWKTELAEQFENDGNPDPFRARERSRGKKIILVVDHYVPTFDKDAGSRTTWEYLQMFLKKGFEVKFVGDNFLHEEPYTSALEQKGIEVLYGPEMQTGIWDWILRNQKEIHRVYLNRPHIATRYIDFIQSRTDIKVIYYGHDLHFLREEREYELTGDIKVKESSDYWKSVELTLLRKADISYYPSETECRAIHAIDPDIRVKAITAYVWDEFPEKTRDDYAEREGILFVGGFAHPPNADGVLWFGKEIWPLIREKDKIECHIVGSHEPDEIKAMDDPENGMHIRGFVTDEELKDLYDHVRIVIVPLRYGAGVKGKVIEALYYGLPVVTTSVGAEGIPEAESVMKIADTPQDFARAVLDLYRDTAALSKMSGMAREYTRMHNSEDAVWDIIRNDFA